MSLACLPGWFVANIHGEFSGPAHQIVDSGRNAAHQGNLHRKSRMSLLRLSSGLFDYQIEIRIHNESESKVNPTHTRHA